MEGKAAVLGNADFVMPFSALGIDTFPVHPGDDTGIANTAEEILKRQFSLVVVAENIAAEADAVFSRTQQDPRPCVLVVPFTTESEGFAVQALGSLLKSATGIDILAG